MEPVAPCDHLAITREVGGDYKVKEEESRSKEWGEAL